MKKKHFQTELISKVKFSRLQIIYQNDQNA